MGRTLQIICGVVLAVGVMALRQAPDPQGVTQPSPAIERQANNGGGGTGTEPDQPLSVIVLETQEQAQATERREREAQDHDAKDLEAQIRAANAAEEQISPALAAAVLSFIGTVLIAVAVVVSIADLRQARSSNRDTVRAYVYVEKGSVKWGHEGVVATLRIVNGGQTPALNFSLVGGGSIEEKDSPIEIAPFDSNRAKTWSVLGSGQGLTASVSSEKVDVADLRSDGSNQLVVSGVVRYTTIFHEVLETEFSFALRRRPGKELHTTLQIAPRLNRAFVVLKS